MNIEFTTHPWDDFTFWLGTDNNNALKIKALIKAIKQNPFQGIGKPEPLKHGLWIFSQKEVPENTGMFTQFPVKRESVDSIMIKNNFIKLLTT